MLRLRRYDKRPSKRKNRSPDSENLDLTAFLSVMMKLVPVMLTATAFARYCIIDSSLTQISRAQEQTKVEEAKKSERINLTLAISDDGYTLGSADKILSRDVVVSTGAPTSIFHIPKRNGKYDNQALGAYFGKMHDRYPAEDTVIITASDNVKYENIIDAMDLARVQVVPSATGKGTERKQMFPNVVIASRTIGAMAEGGSR